MDYFKDMGIRYKELAERQFAKYDYVGAKKLLKKQKICFQGLIYYQHSLLLIIDIYLSRNKFVDGERD